MGSGSGRRISPSTTRTHTTQTPQGKLSMAGGNNTTGAATAPGASSRFMVKVLDRGGLPAILETLHDGQPKLQQAYLNIINYLFSSREMLVRWHRRKQEEMKAKVDERAKSMALETNSAVDDPALFDEVLGREGGESTSILSREMSDLPGERETAEFETTLSKQ